MDDSFDQGLGPESGASPAVEPEAEAVEPAVAELLAFAPVPRKFPRHDGWTPERQRLFIAGLVATGHPATAAQALGLTLRGAYSLRKEAGAEEFAAAWDEALALHARRKALAERAERAGRAARRGRGSGAGGGSVSLPDPNAEEDMPDGGAVSEAQDRANYRLLSRIIDLYEMKLRDERKARLAGRIVEADFYVRQLSFLEVFADLGDFGQELAELLKARHGRDLRDIVATPMSLLLNELRRHMWREKGEPERPPLPRLGRREGGFALGEPPESEYRSGRDGPDYKAARQRTERACELRAEAQRLWEARALAEAEAWSAREDWAAGPAD
jgi:hypothetical protein